MEDALNALGNCIEAKAQTESQKEIVNRSYVLLGYIFYEQMVLSKAVTACEWYPNQVIISKTHCSDYAGLLCVPVNGMTA